jgi:hypothetical protein
MQKQSCSCKSSISEQTSGTAGRRAFVKVFLGFLTFFQLLITPTQGEMALAEITYGELGS